MEITQAKKLRNINDIVEAVKEVADEEKALYDRFQGDYGLCRGEPHPDPDDNTSFTDNRAIT